MGYCYHTVFSWGSTNDDTTNVKYIEVYPDERNCGLNECLFLIIIFISLGRLRKGVPKDKLPTFLILFITIIYKITILICILDNL